MEFFHSVQFIFIILLSKALAQGWISVESAYTITNYDGGVPATTITVAASTIIHYKPGGNQIVRPSSGEVITAGGPYTIQWSSPAANKINLELNDDNGDAREYGTKECEGWLFNSECGSLVDSLANTGEFVWTVNKLDDVFEGFNSTFWLEIYVPSDSNMDPEQYPYYSFSKNFTILQPVMSAASTTEAPPAVASTEAPQPPPPLSISSQPTPISTPSSAESISLTTTAPFGSSTVIETSTSVLVITSFGSPIASPSSFPNNAIRTESNTWQALMLGIVGVLASW